MPNPTTTPNLASLMFAALASRDVSDLDAKTLASLLDSAATYLRRGDQDAARGQLRAAGLVETAPATAAISTATATAPKAKRQRKAKGKGKGKALRAETKLAGAALCQHEMKCTLSDTEYKPSHGPAVLRIKSEHGTLVQFRNPADGSRFMAEVHGLVTKAEKRAARLAGAYRVYNAGSARMRQLFEAAGFETSTGAVVYNFPKSGLKPPKRNWGAL